MFIKRLAAVIVFILTAHAPALAQEQVAQAAVPHRNQQDKDKANQNTVTILASSIYTNFVEDIFKVLDDRKNNDLRVWPCGAAPTALAPSPRPMIRPI